MEKLQQNTKKKEGREEVAVQLKSTKEKVRDLSEKYKLEMQKEKKALFYSQLEKAQKELQELEEKMDTLPLESEQEKKIARLQVFKEKIKELNEKYTSEPQREQKAILYSQLEEAQKEYRKLEEELDSTSTEGKKKNDTPEENKNPEETEKKDKETEKTPEGKDGLVMIFINLLEKAKEGDVASIKILIEFVTTHKIEIKITGPEPTPEEIEAQKVLIVLLEKIRGGDVTVINELIVFLSVHVITITIINIEPPRPPQPPQPPTTPESTSSIEELRDLYLKAKRLRGNVFRGGFGRLFKRKLNFGKEEMDFGGKEGALELERVRREYQEGLSQYRSTELRKTENDVSERLRRGEITPVEANAEMQGKIIDLLSEEQGNVDKRSVEGIEKNMFEKMKTKWRQFGKTRLVAGALLGGAAIATAGTVVGAGVVGARAVMGGVGTYVGVESGLERYSKLVGHKGLINEINKTNFITDESLYRHIYALSQEDVKKEAARLRMLQIEKGLSMDNMDNKRRIAAMIIKRDNELTAQETMASAYLENPALRFADRLSNRLSMEVNSRNEVIESEVDRERIKKMFRKTTAVLAGGTVGWLIGGKLFHKPDVVAPHTPETATTPIIPETVPETLNHTVTTGENTWKIIESNLDSHNTMSGLGEGARTHMIDALKDRFDAMSPAELRGLGFSSGDADLLYVGDSLNMSGVLDNPHTVLDALFNAKSLSPLEITEIVKNNTEISQWLAAHHQELEKIFDSSVVEEVLRGIR